MLHMLRATECLLADRLGLRPIVARTLSVFSSVHTVLTLPPGFLVCCRNCGLKLLYPFYDGVVIRNLSMSPNVRMPSEYLLCCYRRIIIFKKVSAANAQCTADH
jgi:hypothetical protein